MNLETNNTIVVVEDNPADLWLVREALKAHCVRCVIQPVPDGEQALNINGGVIIDHEAPRRGHFVAVEK